MKDGAWGFPHGQDTKPDKKRDGRIRKDHRTGKDRKGEIFLCHAEHGRSSLCFFASVAQGKRKIVSKRGFSEKTRPRKRFGVGSCVCNE